MSRQFGIRRRALLAAGAGLAAGTQLPPGSNSAPASAAQPPKPSTHKKFVADWATSLDRPWLGPAYWANPLQDWQVRDGAAECIGAAPHRNVQLLTREITEIPRRIVVRVTIGRVDGSPLAQGKGSAGFRVGVRGPLGDYRNALIFGKGLDAGFTADGRLFIGGMRAAGAAKIDLAGATAVDLTLTAEPRGDAYDVTLAAAPSGGEPFPAVAEKRVAFADLAGNLALVANFGGEPPAGALRRAAGKTQQAGRQGAAGAETAGAGQFRFSDWTIEGADDRPERAFGPILFAQYTLSAGTLRLTAQMPPLGPGDGREVSLQAGSRTLTAPIHPEARTATFTLSDWKADADVPYRLGYALAGREPAESAEYDFAGVIRREPTDRPTLSVADISCNIHAAFPNAEYVAHLEQLNPDFLAFTGDQFYESTGGYGVTVEPLDKAILDYLRKWYLHGWTWRDVTRDRPSISIPDDHDVYQGNIWGESGAPQSGTQERGGYRMPAPWVNVVHRTQTSHHPDPYDPAPVKQGILQYFGRLVYAGIDFAILADRMYKSAPEGNVPPTGGRGDHVTDPNFDPRTADVAGLELLGPGQEKFLAEWAALWDGVKMKAVLSQTIFTSMATTHGGVRDRLRADYDTNGWPQTARRRAVELIRKAGAFHIAGDQHLPAIVQYGIESPRDAGYAFAGPAVNVGYPRWWEPTEAGVGRAAGSPENTGDFRDHFGNWMTVVAVANGALQPRTTVLEQMADKASGLGLVRFDKAAQKITIDCWPYLVDPTAPDARQFPGWPVTIDCAEVSADFVTTTGSGFRPDVDAGRRDH